jgi:hypothetical protein
MTQIGHMWRATGLDTGEPLADGQAALRLRPQLVHGQSAVDVVRMSSDASARRPRCASVFAESGSCDPATETPG